MSDSYSITLKKIKNDYRFTVRWSPYYRMEKFLIRSHIPAEGGVFQIYKKDGHGLLLIISDYAYYGGLRATLREFIDPLSPRDYPLRDVMMSEECYVRYSLSSQQMHMHNVTSYIAGWEPQIEEGEEVYVNEVDNLSIKREPEVEKDLSQRAIESIGSFFVGSQIKPVK